MTEPQHEENVDTGALTDDAVPTYEEPAPVDEPYQEAPGSPSSEADEHASAEEATGSEGPDADLPHGAEMHASNEEAAKHTVAGSPPGDDTLPVAHAEQQQ